MCKRKYENIEFFIIGHSTHKNIKSYEYNNIHEFNALLTTHKPNIIIDLSIWPETYSYTLTLSMITELPILYYKKTGPSVVEDRLKKYNKSYEFSTFEEAIELIKSKGQFYLYTINPILRFSTYWNELFVNKRKTINQDINVCNQFKYDIKPYFIYFPQYHEIYENNINFYTQYTDIHNLKHYNETNIEQKDIPLIEYCSIEDYDYIQNTSIIQRQVDLINDYHFSGVAMYYYWFSTNTYTNNHIIMKQVIDKFFQQQQGIHMHDKKIFFIWANENWTNNVALCPNDNTQTQTQSIVNEYNEITFKQNSIMLMTYFKHEHYLKIDNKPVFFIYHSYLINNIDEFYTILNNECIQSGFNGVQLVLNSFEKNYNHYKNFYINFNYKKYNARFYDKNENQIKLDYKKYIEDNHHCQPDKIQTIVFDFDNKARLCKPNQLNKSTVCINNTEMHKTLFIHKLLETYKNNSSNNSDNSDNSNSNNSNSNNSDNSKNELDKILLINALNEWGETMTFEPSENIGYYNLNLLSSLLKK
jgi:hypothetical protein